MNKKIFLMVSLLILVFAGCSQKEDENIEKVVPVKIYNVKSESISNFIRATGPISADDDVIVYSKVAERVMKLYVKPGQRVAKNQIIAEQKNDILKQGMEMANSALKTAAAHAKLAVQDFERMEKLYAEKAISVQQYDQARTAKETAEYSLNQAKSAFEQAKEQYENSFAKAPFDGIAASVFAEENQMLNMGQPVAQVISPSKMKAKVYLTGEDIQNVKINQSVLIKFPQLPNSEFKGRVEKINSAIDQMSKGLEVEISVNSNDTRVKSGMFAEFQIETEKRNDSYVVPETALLPQTEVIINKDTGLQNSMRKYFLFVIDDGAAKLKEVKTGIISNGQAEITSGVNLGDKVIIVGQNIVKEGQKVNIIE